MKDKLFKLNQMFCLSILGGISLFYYSLYMIVRDFNYLIMVGLSLIIVMQFIYSVFDFYRYMDLSNRYLKFINKIIKDRKENLELFKKEIKKRSKEIKK